MTVVGWSGSPLCLPGPGHPCLADDGAAVPHQLVLTGVLMLPRRPLPEAQHLCALIQVGGSRGREHLAHIARHRPPSWTLRSWGATLCLQCHAGSLPPAAVTGMRDVSRQQLPVSDGRGGGAGDWMLYLPRPHPTASWASARQQHGCPPVCREWAWGALENSQDLGEPLTIKCKCF